MTTIAIEAATYDGLTDRRQVIVDAALDRLRLGDPAHHTDGTTEHVVFDDDRFDPQDVKMLDAILSDLPAVDRIRAGVDTPDDGPPVVTDRAALRRALRGALQIRDVDPDDPWQAAHLRVNPDDLEPVDADVV